MTQKKPMIGPYSHGPKHLGPWHEVIKHLKLEALIDGHIPPTTCQHAGVSLEHAQAPVLFTCFQKARQSLFVLGVAETWEKLQ